MLFKILLPCIIYVVFLSILEPIDKVSNLTFKSFLCLPVVKLRIFVELSLTCVPAAEPLIGIHFPVIKYFAECTCQFLLLWVFLDEEENDSLEKMQRAFFSILFDKFFESFLKLCPILHNVVFWRKQPAKENIELVITCDIELVLDLTNL